MSEYSAEASALGYIYQVRYALYQLLLLGDDYNVVIECLDDIAFERDGTATDLLQLKHHLSRKASLTDMSVDLWKSLRVWSDYLLQNQGDLPSLNLVTTARASENSAAYFLKDEYRDEEKALGKIITAAENSANQSLTDCFAKFRELDDRQKQLLVSKIHILDLSPTTVDLEGLIKTQLRLAILPSHLQGLYERLEGWWFNKAILYLSGKLKEAISGLEIHYKVNDIAKQFEPEALPLDFLDVEPPEDPDPVNDQRLFVKQLHEISIDTKRIEHAIRDFYKAFEQRSRWAGKNYLSMTRLNSMRRD